MSRLNEDQSLRSALFQPLRKPAMHALKGNEPSTRVPVDFAVAHNDAVL